MKRVLSFVGLLMMFHAAYSQGGENAKEELKLLWSNAEMRLSLNYSLLRSLSEAEKAIVAYYAMRGGTDCKVRNNELHCKLTDALGFPQCKKAHRALIYKWFRGELEIIEDISHCYAAPRNDKRQKELLYLSIIRQGNQRTVKFKMEGFNKKSGEHWKIDGVGYFRIYPNKVVLIDEHEKLSYH